MKYSMVIQWSDVDETYIVSLPEWSDLVHTHGDTYDEAVRSGETVLTMLIKSAQEKGPPLPPPTTYVA
jgi:predicted RNase H-like HicB family nuclease